MENTMNNCFINYIFKQYNSNNIFKVSKDKNGEIYEEHYKILLEDMSNIIFNNIEIYDKYNLILENITNACLTHGSSVGIEPLRYIDIINKVAHYNLINSIKVTYRLFTYNELFSHIKESELNPSGNDLFKTLFNYTLRQTRRLFNSEPRSFIIGKDEVLKYNPNISCATSYHPDISERLAILSMDCSRSIRNNKNDYLTKVISIITYQMAILIILGSSSESVIKTTNKLDFSWK